MIVHSVFSISSSTVHRGKIGSIYTIALSYEHETETSFSLRNGPILFGL